MKILVVEDDKSLNETIVDFLEFSNFKTISVFDGEEAVIKSYENSFDIIILDVKLPKLNGFQVATKIREFSNIPIIFLTSLDDEKDIEKGFISGGDDYLTKPFSLKELKFRIEAILRRVYHNHKIVKIDDFEYDTTNKELKRDDNIIHLKPKVIKLLDLFIKNQNEIIGKEMIFNEIYEYDETPNEGSLRTFINNLREIFGKDKIVTIKGRGYKFVG